MNSLNILILTVSNWPRPTKTTEPLHLSETNCSLCFKQAADFERDRSPHSSLPPTAVDPVDFESWAGLMHILLHKKHRSFTGRGVGLPGGYRITAQAQCFVVVHKTPGPGPGVLDCAGLHGGLFSPKQTLKP